MEESKLEEYFSHPLARVMLIAVIGIITFIPFVLAIDYVDIYHEAMAFDWRNSFHGAIWLEDFGWTSRAFRTPPWAVWYFLPFTALSYEMGWAVMMYLTALVLVRSVPYPSRRFWVAGNFLLLTAHPTLRNFADVNLEAFVIAGLLLCLYAFNDKKVYWLSAGILLAAIKPQSIFLVFAVMGLYMLRSYPWKETAKVVAICGGVFVVTMLMWGQAWVGSITTVPPGISITAGLAELNFPPITIASIQIIIIAISVFVAWRGKAELDRTKIGLLVSASVFAAPYANGPSVVPVLAFGGIAILMKRPWLGIFVFALYNLPFLEAFGVEEFIVSDAIYFMIIQFITWVILLFDVYQEAETEREESIPLIEEKA